MTGHSLLMIDLSGTSPTPDERALLHDYNVGGICLFRRNLQDRYQTAELTTELRELCGEHLVIGIDQEGGTVVRALDVPFSPGNMALGAVNDLTLTRQVAGATARGLKSLGITLNFAPVADVNNNPDNPVIGDRSFGSDAKRVARHVSAFVQGLQAEGVAATIKHFPGHGNTATDSHHDLPKLEASLEQLEQTELIPFRAGITAGAACVMSYHGIIKALDPENPGTLSHKVITNFLRDTLGFDGVTFSDALEMKAIAKLYSPEESVIRALAAGIDMPLYNVHQTSVKQHESIFKAIDRAAQEGRLDKRKLEHSKLRLKRLTQRYPAKANPEAAWQKGDEELLEQTAKRAVTTVGNLPILDKTKPVTLITANNQVGGSASDMTSTPAYTLVKKLEKAGLAIQAHFYNSESFEGSSLPPKLSDTVLFVSASRTRISVQEIELANALAKQSKTFIHVALWNPYSIQHIPKPAVLSFGFSEAALQQIVDVLLGAASEGQLPFEL
jgi:beta-N-acetylhexosaminidase